jgi:protein-disulfide isomerase
MKNEIQKKSGIPIAVIGLVFLLVIGGGVWFYYSSKPANTANNARANNANVPKSPTAPTNAPPGANPPNQSGSPTASVTLEEFADFQCPQCAAKHPIMNEVKSMYGGRIHFIFRDFPLEIAAHDKSYDAAVAAEAAGMQGKFWEMHNQLFTNQSAWTANPNYKQVWNEYAQKIGLDAAKFQTDMAGIATKGRVDADKQRGKVLGVNSTPSLYLNGVLVQFEQMTVDGLKQLIDAELQKSTPQTQPAAPANTNK